MSTRRIKPGTPIEWDHSVRGRLSIYEGTVLAFVPAGADLYRTYYAIPLPQRVHHDAPPSGLLSVSQRDRYLVRCKEGYRCPNAGTVERQNPDAAREP